MNQIQVYLKTLGVFVNSKQSNFVRFLSKHEKLVVECFVQVSVCIYILFKAIS